MTGSLANGDVVSGKAFGNASSTADRVTARLEFTGDYAIVVLRRSDIGTILYATGRVGDDLGME